MTTDQLNLLLGDPQPAHFLQLVNLINQAPASAYESLLKEAESALESWPDAFREVSLRRFFERADLDHRHCEFHLWRHLSSLGTKPDQVPILCDLVERSTLITQMTLSGKFGRSGFKELLALGALSHLEVLEVRGQSNTNAKALWKATHLTKLRSLSWLRAALDTKMLDQMIQAPHLQALEVLDLGGNDKLTEQGLKALAGGTHFGQLRSLGLFHTMATDEGVRALSEATGFGQLAYLELSSNEGVGDGAACSLTESSFWQGLRFLGLSSTSLSDQGVASLARAAQPSQLQALALSGNQLTDQSAEAIAASTHLGDLFYLDLSSNKLTPKGLEALLDSPHLSSLKRLKVGANQALRDVGAVKSQHPLKQRCDERGILLNEYAHMGPLSLERLPVR